MSSLRILKLCPGTQSRGQTRSWQLVIMAISEVVFTMAKGWHVHYVHDGVWTEWPGLAKGLKGNGVEFGNKINV